MYGISLPGVFSTHFGSSVALGCEAHSLPAKEFCTVRCRCPLHACKITFPDVPVIPRVLCFDSLLGFPFLFLAAPSTHQRYHPPCRQEGAQI